MAVRIQGTLHKYSLSPKSPLLSAFSASNLKQTHLLFSSKNSSSLSITNGALPFQFGLINANNYPLFLRSSRRRSNTNNNNKKNGNNINRVSVVVASSSSGNVAAPLWDTWSPDKASASPSLSDILWPSLGAFAAMAMLGKVDEMLAPRGISMTIAPLGAVCAVLFITPKSPAARKYNMFMAQIGCAAIGVLAFSLLGPGCLARSVALAASIAFMISTKSNHPPAASLPLLFIDGAKLHHLNFWYSLFPGAAGCIILSLIVSSFSFPLPLHGILSTSWSIMPSFFDPSQLL
ncbi:hypothetical protein Cgig2_006167 [Carnegiea gigantea]|uniref:HPP transmembrane region domain-containing protein n=1 Tax=Carnegiea gigantea TaxID=171969 RepID=A0A9Q1KZ09_9CARY|nr:hypothetical protein Cgig2_006167 [Carnegiea gigantea]